MNKQFPQIHQLQALGTKWWLGFGAGYKAEDFLPGIRSKIEDFENDYSRFKQDSLISKLNDLGRLERPPQELIDMLNYAEKLRVVSSGYFDISIGGKLEQLGYDSDYSFKVSDSAASVGSIRTSNKLIEVDQGVRIDLGGFGKGWLIDELVQMLKPNVDEFFINAGGDAYVHSKSDRRTEFGLEDPKDTESQIGSIEIANAAIACSAPNRRVWRDATTGRSVHHLVQLQEFVPNKEISAVFAYGNTAREVDAACTIIYLAPAQVAKRIQDELGIEIMIVFEDGTYFSTKDYPGVLNS